MSLKYSILATEGAHDQAVLCKILKLLGLRSFKGDLQYLDTFWLHLIPKGRKITKNVENLYAHNEVHVPRFFTSQSHSVAVYQGAGKNLPQNLFDIMSTYQSYSSDIHALGIIIDADNRLPDIVVKEYSNNWMVLIKAIGNHLIMRKLSSLR